MDEGSRLLEKHLTRWLENRGSSDEEFTGYVRLIGGNLEVKEFFVYEMEDGSFQIQATFFGVVEIEYEAEVTEEHDLWEYDYDYESYGESAFRLRARPQRRTRTKTTEVETWVVVEGSGSEAGLDEWSVIDAWVD